MPDLREWYLAEVDGRLRGRIPTADLAILLRELETHLYEAHDNVLGSGASDEDAQRAAIESLGHPAQIARAELRRRSRWLPLANVAVKVAALILPLAITLTIILNLRFEHPYEPSLLTRLPDMFALGLGAIWVWSAWISGQKSFRPFLVGFVLAIGLMGLFGARTYRTFWFPPDWNYFGIRSQVAYVTQPELKSGRAEVQRLYDDTRIYEQEYRSKLHELNAVNNLALDKARSVKIIDGQQVVYFKGMESMQVASTGQPRKPEQLKAILSDPSPQNVLYEFAAYDLHHQIRQAQDMYITQVNTRLTATKHLARIDNALNTRSALRAVQFLKNYVLNVVLGSLVFLGLSSLAAWLSRRLVPSNRVVKSLSKA